MRGKRFFLLTLSATVLLGQPVHAVDSREWVLDRVEDFLPGTFESVVVRAPGTLAAGHVESMTPIDAAHVWSVAQDENGVIYAGTGNEARVYIVDGSDDPPFLELDGSQVYALEPAAGGGVFAATSPYGAIYKITDADTVVEWFRPTSAYTWALLTGDDGALYAATGNPATIVKVTALATGSIMYSSDELHIMALAQHTSGALLAGAYDSGVVMAVQADGSARVLYDTPVDEIRRILPTEDGTIYFVGVHTKGGATPATTALKLSDVSGTGNGTNGNGEKKQEATPPARPLGPASSLLYRIDPSGAVVPLWTASGHRVFDAAMFEGDVLLSTDAEGAVFRVSPDGVPAIAYRGRHMQAVSLATTQSGAVLVGTADGASVVQLGPAQATEASYTSAVQDVGSMARFGRVRWSVTDQRNIPAIKLRSGNTSEPDDGWSAWTEASRAHEGADFKVPPARFLQFAVEWGRGSRNTAVTRVNIPFVPENLPPRVLSVEVETPGWIEPAEVNTGRGSEESTLASVLKRYSNGDGKPKSKSKEAEEHDSEYTVTWKAVDPNEDTLEFTVEYRGVNETLWKLLDDELEKLEYEWETRLVPDGWYELRITADDAPSNATGTPGTFVSEQVLVDNTGPGVSPLRVREGGGEVRISGSAVDRWLPIRRGMYALDGQPWRWFAPQDGIFDSAEESFVIELGDLESGEHSVAVRVLDAAHNVGYGSLVFTAQ